MNSKLTLTKRKRLLLATVVICTVLIAGLAILWQGGKVSEAAVLDIHPGLVGWWRFDEGTGTVASDNSSNGNSGTITGASWVAGIYGQALSFDGTVNDYVSVPSLNIASGPFSISVWVKPAAHSDFMTIMGFDSSRRLLISSNGLLLTQFGDNFFSVGTVPNNAWSLVTYVYNGTYENWYINGVYDSQHLPTSTPKWESAFYIGQYNLINYPDSGTIDEVRIYNRTLSAAEIQADYQTNPNLPSSLLAKVPKGTTDFIATLSWQGIGSINVTIQSPSQTYTEDTLPVYEKTTYSVSGGTSTMLNIKRLEVSIAALTSDQNWYIILQASNVQDYKMTVEVQK